MEDLIVVILYNYLILKVCNMYISIYVKHCRECYRVGMYMKNKALGEAKCFIRIEVKC